MENLKNWDWEQYRNEDGSLDLISAYEQITNNRCSQQVLDFFTMVRTLRPIKSKQMAALAVTMASHIDKLI